MKKLMTLDEAIAIEKLVLEAKSKGMRTRLPSETINLAGACVSFCKHNKRKVLYRKDLEKQEIFLRKKWIESGKNPSSEYWGRMIACQKILENWKETVLDE